MSGQIDGPTRYNAELKFHQALDLYPKWPLGRTIGHSLEGNYVDDTATDVIEALLLAGWTPPVVTNRPTERAK